MDDFTRIRTFIKVVQASSFSAVARDVSSTSSVARQVKSLEEELGVRLLNRNTRGLSLTDAGRRFYERVVGVVHQLDAAKAETRSMQDDVKGLLRVSLRITAGMTVIIPALPRLFEKHPELTIEISLTNEQRDLIANNIDVAVWLGELPDSDIVARRLSPSRHIVCGTPEYFTRHGTPANPQDLRNHSCLLFTGPTYRNRWSFMRAGEHEEVEVHGSVQSDNGLVLLTAGLAHLGIIIVQEWMVRNLLVEGRMIQIFQEYAAHPRAGDIALYAMYSSNRHLSRKIRAFVDFLVETFEVDESQSSAM